MPVRCEIWIRPFSTAWAWHSAQLLNRLVSSPWQLQANHVPPPRFGTWDLLKLILKRPKYVTNVQNRQTLKLSNYSKSHDHKRFDMQQIILEHAAYYTELTSRPTYSTWRACFHFSSITVKWDACRRCLCDHCKVLCAALKSALLRNVHRYYRHALASGFGSAALSYLILNHRAMTVISW